MSAPAPQRTEHGTGQVELDTHQKTQEQQIREAHAHKFEEGQENAHELADRKDERSHKNTVAAASKAAKEEEKRENEPAPLPTAAAEAHGNEPSKGAKIDEQLMIEEEIELANKNKK